MTRQTVLGIFKILIGVLLYIILTIIISAQAVETGEASAVPLMAQENNAIETPPVPQPPPDVTEPTKQVTLALVGDILLDSWVGTEIKRQGVDYPWAGVKDILSSADAAIGNLESPAGVTGFPIKGKTFTFRARPDTLQGAVNAGIDVLTLANNHILDYGPGALGETLDNLDQYGIARTGAGRNIKEAMTPAIQECGGLKVGVLSFSRVIPYPGWVVGPNHPGVANGWDAKTVLQAIQQADSQVDVLVVSIHWGIELADYPAKDQQNLAKAMVDSGADVILGHHSHCLQGVEVYKEKPILYSMGNFIFTSSSLKARSGAIALVTMEKDGVKNLQMIPTRLNRGQPQVLTDKAKVAEIIRLQSLSKPFGLQFNNEGKAYLSGK